MIYKDNTPLKTNMTLENPILNRKYFWKIGGLFIVMLVFGGYSNVPIIIGLTVYPTDFFM